MTTAQVEQFLEKVGQDESLQKELAGALAAEDDRQAVTNLAKTKGYEFTPDELWAEVQKRQAEIQNKQDSGELSDDELEDVAGGAWFDAVRATVAVGSFAYNVGKDIAPKIKW